jgi:hypothetical protein
MALLEQLFSTGGDGSGATEMAGLPVAYKIVPPPGFTYEIHRVNVCIEDDVALGGDLYSGIAALTNGILITNKRGDVITTHTPQPIKMTYRLSPPTSPRRRGRNTGQDNEGDEQWQNSRVLGWPGSK